MTLDTLIPAKFTEVLGNIVDYYKINLFDFDYTLPEGAGITPAELQQAFIDRFYFREIGQETITMFRHYLKARWVELIAVYGRIFVSNELSDPSDLTNDEYDNNGLSVFNDAPKGIVEFDKNHATSYTTSESHTKGRRGRTKAELARAYRDLAFNPLQDFLDDLDELFMQIY